MRLYACNGDKYGGYGFLRAQGLEIGYMPSLENTEPATVRNPLVDVMERLARIEARLNTMATKEDLAKLETKLTNKFWSTMFAIAVMAAGLVATAIRVWL